MGEVFFSIPLSNLLYRRTGIFNKFDTKNSIGRIGTCYCTAKLEIFNSVVICYMDKKYNIHEEIIEFVEP